MAKYFRGKEDADLFRKIKNDDFMRSAVIECYETLRYLLVGILEDKDDKMQGIFKILERAHQIDRKERFERINIYLTHNISWREKDRINDPNLGYQSKDENELIRYWVSYRGQTHLQGQVKP
ncbi:hypothetical protein RND71_012877 [Anisodus tanguticus]|uniref:Callose synthase helical domain-containing protein n=1 Tax=Anisodus tanguticus TaxID=243964 RepID=A0AAE1VR37_9SOLA|nr:hypothetical protein RND71_012877 [Anisodus tanguticus]